MTMARKEMEYKYRGRTIADIESRELYEMSADCEMSDNAIADLLDCDASQVAVLRWRYGISSSHTAAVDEQARLRAEYSSACESDCCERADDELSLSVKNQLYNGLLAARDKYFGHRAAFGDLLLN